MSDKHMKSYMSIMKMISEMALKASQDHDGEQPDDKGHDETEMIAMKMEAPMQDTPDLKQKDEGSPNFKDFTKNLLARKKPEVRQSMVMKPKKPSDFNSIASETEASLLKRGRGRPKKAHA